MLVLSRRTGARIAVVRASIELVALTIGFALGGTVGAGTVAVALLLVAFVEGNFWLFTRVGLATRGEVAHEPASEGGRIS
jgi:uncharacterized membrane protein YczE